MANFLKRFSPLFDLIRIFGFYRLFEIIVAIAPNAQSDQKCNGQRTKSGETLAGLRWVQFAETPGAQFNLLGASPALCS